VASEDPFDSFAMLMTKVGPAPFHQEDPALSQLYQKYKNSIACYMIYIAEAQFPALLDSVANNVEREYTGWPDRLYLIGKYGRICDKSEPGPFRFPPDNLAQAMQQLP